MKRYDIKRNFTFGKQRNKPCLLPAAFVVVVVYANFYTLQNIAAFHNLINVLLSYEMFVINVIDDFFFTIAYYKYTVFLIKYLGITQFTRSQAKNRHECPNTCLVCHWNVLVYVFYIAFFLVYRNFAFQSIANLSKNTASVAWGSRMTLSYTHIESQG